MSGSLYDTDFHAWANQQAALLRAGKLSQADVAHIAEEIESMGRTEKRELISRLTVLLLHLLKWRQQPERRGRSWSASIRVQRRDVARLIADNPSLKSSLDQCVADAYGDAVIKASAETDLPEETFPTTCPWSVDRMMTEDFWPE